MIVIVVIGILATIAVPKYMSVTRKAKEAEAKMMLSPSELKQRNVPFARLETFIAVTEAAGGIIPPIPHQSFFTEKNNKPDEYSTRVDIQSIVRIK